MEKTNERGQGRRSTRANRSALGKVKSRNFTSTDPVSHSGNTNTWLTPLWIIDRLGTFDLDPCAYPGYATARNLISLPDDGLKAKWTGRVWLNPPYGRHAGKWLEKLADHGDGVALIFARTDTTYFQKISKRADAFLFIRGRISFLNSQKVGSTNAGAPSVLLAFGKKNVDALRHSGLGFILTR